MQTLIFILAISINAFASSDKLTLTIQRKYSKQFLRIYSEDGKLKCDTENQPPFNLDSEPTSDLKLPSQQKIMHTKNCRDKVEIRKDKEEITGCLEDQRIKEIVTKLNSICRY